MRLPTLTGEFRCGGDPELRFTQAGKAVASLSLIATESRKNRQTDEWEDGDSTPWITATMWEQQAEQLCESGITKGDLVLVTGALFVREYETRDGSKGTSVELKYATVALVPRKASRGQGGSQGGGRAPQQRGTEDPWASPQRQQPSGGSDPWARNDEPPF